jgi:hypothetical protein
MLWGAHFSPSFIYVSDFRGRIVLKRTRYHPAAYQAVCLPTAWNFAARVAEVRPSRFLRTGNCSQLLYECAE